MVIRFSKDIHLDYYTLALEEMIRVSNKHICIIFWLLNDNDDIMIDYL